MRLVCAGAIDAHASVAYNGYLYTIGGAATGGVTSTVVYARINGDGTLGSWSTTQALPYTDQLHASVAYSSYLYTIGGAATGGVTSTVVYCQ